MMEEFFKGLMRKWLINHYKNTEDRLSITKLSLQDLSYLIEREYSGGLDGFWKEHYLEE